MSAETLSSYLTSTGELLSLNPEAPVLDDISIQTEDVFPGYCKSGIMIRYGSLGVFRFIMQYIKYPTPILNSVLSSDAAFTSYLKKISDFYSSVDSAPISSEDAFNLLRLYVHGGGMKRWVEGLKSGTFTTQDGTIIGKTTVKSGQKLEMNNLCRWERPPWLHAFSAEMEKACNYLCGKNLISLDELGPDLNNSYQKRSRFINHLISLVQLSIMVHVIPFLKSYNVRNIVTTPSTYQWHGVLTTDQVFFNELSNLCDFGTLLYKLQFGPMAMPLIASTTTPFTRTSVFASLGKRKLATMDSTLVTNSPPADSPLQPEEPNLL